MSSEWLKIMLDEIARKRAEAADALVELERRHSESGTSPAGEPGDAGSHDSPEG